MQRDAMRLYLGFIAVWISSIIASGLHAATLDAPTDVAFTATYDGSTQRYMELKPTTFNSQNQYDILIALHGSGSNRMQYATMTSIAEIRATQDAAADHEMILICPDYRATHSWMGPAAEADVLQIIQNLKAQYNIGQTFITGGSMGGSSSLTFTALHPDLIDGVCAVNGLADFNGFPNFQDDIAASFGGTPAQVPLQYYNRSAINSPQSFTMPLSVTAGGVDTIVPPQSILQLANTVKNTNPQNPTVASFYRPNGGHNTPYVDNAVALEYVIRNAKGINTDLNLISVNNSFEYQKLNSGTTFANELVDGWTTAGPDLRVTNPSAVDYAAKFSDPRPDGDQMLYAKSSIFQFLGTTVKVGTYHFSLEVGSPSDNAAVATFLAGFKVASTNVVALNSELTWGDTDSYTGPPLTAGQWSSLEFDWTVVSGDAAVGKYLYFYLNPTSNNYVYFDDLSVTFTPTPEPTSLCLLIPGIMGIHLFRKASGRVKRHAR